MADLLDAGCQILTLGQYLRPAADRVPVVRYLSPHEFDELGLAARRMGFRQVISGPPVRSSYRAETMV
jgi:lipoic acid synthetase